MNSLTGDEGVCDHAELIMTSASDVINSSA